uniref:ATP synthase F0 subunit 8 n=1 Tax=Mitjaevia bifurcata TaxID=2896843 RepID=A0A8K1Z3S0_9HEMI|nr:ATP synthase F0 subunit 8 [Mitjaevia bifurcata]
MSPLWWTFLMITFIIVFMFLLSILYFNLDNKMNMSINLKGCKTTWSW